MEQRWKKHPLTVVLAKIAWMAFIVPKLIKILVGNLPLVKFDIAITKLQFDRIREQRCMERLYCCVARERCAAGRIPLNRPPYQFFDWTSTCPAWTGAYAMILSAAPAPLSKNKICSPLFVVWNSIRKTGTAAMLIWSGGRFLSWCRTDIATKILYERQIDRHSLRYSP